MVTKHRPSFDPKSFLARVGDGRSICKYRKGQVVFSQGDHGDAVFYIQKGRAKLTVVSEHGKEVVIAILGVEEFFGEGCLAGQAQRIATVTTMIDSVIARLEKSTIIQVIHQEPAFSEKLIAHLLARSIRVEADLIDQLFNSSEKRLARMLLLLANFGTEGTPEPVIAKISQETLAEMIGTTRSRVSFFMNKFRKLGFIRYNGSIEVHSSLLNVILHRPTANRDLICAHFADAPLLAAIGCQCRRHIVRHNSGPDAACFASLCKLARASSIRRRPIAVLWPKCHGNCESDRLEHFVYAFASFRECIALDLTRNPLEGSVH